VRRRHSQLAKVAAERVLDVVERIPYDLYAPIDQLQFNRRRIILGLANKTKGVALYVLVGMRR